MEISESTVYVGIVIMFGVILIVTGYLIIGPKPGESIKREKPLINVIKTEPEEKKKKPLKEENRKKKTSLLTKISKTKAGKADETPSGLSPTAHRSGRCPAEPSSAIQPWQRCRPR